MQSAFKIGWGIQNVRLVVLKQVLQTAEVSKLSLQRGERGPGPLLCANPPQHTSSSSTEPKFSFLSPNIPLSFPLPALKALQGT